MQDVEPEQPHDMSEEAPDYPVDAGEVDPNVLEGEVVALEKQWEVHVLKRAAEEHGNEDEKRPKKKGKPGTHPAAARAQATIDSIRINHSVQRGKTVKQIMRGKRALVQVQGPSKQFPDVRHLEAAACILHEAAKLSKQTEHEDLKKELTNVKQSEHFMITVMQMVRDKDFKHGPA